MAALGLKPTSSFLVKKILHKQNVSNMSKSPLESFQCSEEDQMDEWTERNMVISSTNLSRQNASTRSQAHNGPDALRTKVNTYQEDYSVSK